MANMFSRVFGKEGRSGSADVRVQLILNNVLVFGLIALVIYFATQSPFFLTWANVKILLVNLSPLAVVCVPFTMLLIAGYIDLSVGSIAAMSALITSLSVVEWGLSRPLALFLGLLVGCTAGAINGYLCTHLDFNPIVTTLGMLSVLRGTALLINEFQVFGLGGLFRTIAAESILGLPVLVWFVAAAFLLGGVFIRFTPWGRHIYAIGSNRQAAFLSGLSIRWLPFWLYVATGFGAALTGILIASRLDGMTPGQLGISLEIQVLTVILLGGVAFAGGRGRLFGVLIAWLFLATLQDGLVLMNVTPYVQLVASGMALVLAAGIDTLGAVLTTRLEERRRTVAQTGGTEPPEGGAACPLPAPGGERAGESRDVTGAPAGS